MPSVEIGHQARPRRLSKLWYLPRSAFEWQTEYIVSPMRDEPQDQVAACKTCGQYLRVTFINYEAMLIRRRRRGRVAVVSWGIFVIMLIITLGFRSPSTWLIMADIVIGVISLTLLLDWWDYSQIRPSGRWRGHRFKH